ncbi:MAG: hypothetical protein WBE48_18135, partial [Xanthobacteraceae bacterium]
MNFADDSVAADADLGGDLAAGQTCSDVGSELFDPFWGPGCGGHERPRCAAARSGPPGGEDRAQRLRPTAHGTAITESH